MVADDYCVCVHATRKRCTCPVSLSCRKRCTCPESLSCRKRGESHFWKLGNILLMRNLQIFHYQLIHSKMICMASVEFWAPILCLLLHPYNFSPRFYSSSYYLLLHPYNFAPRFYSSSYYSSIGARGRVHWLTVLADVAEDPSSVPSTHTGGGKSQPLATSAAGILSPLASMRTCMHMHTHPTHIHII